MKVVEEASVYLASDYNDNDVATQLMNAIKEKGYKVDLEGDRSGEFIKGVKVHDQDPGEVPDRFTIELKVIVEVEVWEVEEL